MCKFRPPVLKSTLTIETLIPILALMLVFMLSISGCSQESPAVTDAIAEGSSDKALIAQENPPAPASTQVITNYDKDEHSADNEIWRNFAEEYGGLFDQMPFNMGFIPEPDMLPLYIDGMSNENAFVRWYCASQAFEYTFHKRSQDVVNALKPLLEDQNEYVRHEAAFSMAILQKSFNSPYISKSPDGRSAAFHAYNEAMYNDSKVWSYNQGMDGFNIYQVDGSAGSINWSPDSTRICVGEYGRIWSDITIIDPVTGIRKGSGLFAYIEKHKDSLGYKIGKNSRPDAYINFLEWSPDSKKVLLFYSFTDDAYQNQKGIAVYNIELDKFERLTPIQGIEDDYNPEPVKPPDFKW